MILMTTTWLYCILMHAMGTACLPMGKAYVNSVDINAAVDQELATA